MARKLDKDGIDWLTIGECGCHLGFELDGSVVAKNVCEVHRNCERCHDKVDCLFCAINGDAKPFRCWVDPHDFGIMSPETKAFMERLGY